MNILKTYFDLKDLGLAKSCLGLNVQFAKNSSELSIKQEAYANKVLKTCNMQECKAVAAPSDLNQKLCKNMIQSPDDTLEEITKERYEEAVGSLLYLSQWSRPDIAYAIRTLGSFSNDPAKSHWRAVKRVLRYVQGTKSLGIKYHQAGESTIVGYADADWANDMDDRKSITGYVFKLQGSPISWHSKKQTTVSKSTPSSTKT